MKANKSGVYYFHDAERCYVKEEISIGGEINIITFHAMSYVNLKHTHVIKLDG